MEREYITIETPKEKKKIKLKKWLTGGEKRSISNALLDNTEFKQDQLADVTIKGDSISKMQDARIEAIVEDIDGNKEKTLQGILNLHSDDFDFVIKEIDKLTGEEQEMVKKSQQTTSG